VWAWPHGVGVLIWFSPDFPLINWTFSSPLINRSGQSLCLHLKKKLYEALVWMNYLAFKCKKRCSQLMKPDPCYNTYYYKADNGKRRRGTRVRFSADIVIDMTTNHGTEVLHFYDDTSLRYETD
jgi:hypothetical protein